MDDLRRVPYCSTNIRHNCAQSVERLSASKAQKTYLIATCKKESSQSNFSMKQCLVIGFVAALAIGGFCLATSTFPLRQRFCQQYTECNYELDQLVCKTFCS